MHDVLRELNEPQREAVQHGDGPLLVLAGAGTGKTRVITRRIAFLIDARDVPEWGLLAITFTNKAAREMRERVEQLLPGRSLWVATFHATCARILRREGPRIGYGSDYAILDEYDKGQLLKTILGDFDLDTKSFRPSAVGHEISARKNHGSLPRPAEEDDVLGYAERILERVFREYERRRRLQNALDFDDLLLETVRLFDEDAEALQEYATRFRHVLVDEYQDTNAIQCRLTKLLSSVHGNVCAVGDPDQSIYSWRGADVRNIVEFERDFPGAHTVRLEQNYRSSGNILAAATLVIRNNVYRQDKRLWTEAAAGDPIAVMTSDDDRQEAFRVVEQIEDWYAGGMRLEEMAVFYRANHLSRSLEEALRIRAIPYQIIGGLEFFQRKEIKDLLAYLWVIRNPAASTALERILNVPPRGIGAKTQERLRVEALERGVSEDALLHEAAWLDGVRGRARKGLQEFVETIDRLRDLQDDVAADVLEQVIVQTGYLDYVTGLGDAREDERTENVGALVSFAREFDAGEGGGLTGFLQQVSLLADHDRFSEHQDKVSLMTLHAAKGLEFDGVVIAGCEDGLLPHAFSIDHASGLEEERRLFHVGMTRARRSLVLSWAHQRLQFGRPQLTVPSRFLREIPHAVVSAPEDPHEIDPFPVVDAPASCDLRVGQRVRHDTFGVGRVLEFRGHAPNTRVVVEFEDRGRKEIFLAYTTMEPVES